MPLHIISAKNGHFNLSTHRMMWWRLLHSVQFSSVAQSCWILCDPMNRSRPGLPVHHQLPEFTQTHVHGVSSWKPNGDQIS